MARALILLAVLTAVRLLVAGWTPLSADEAYYWVWSRALAPGYLDHPPMVALWIRIGTMLAGQGACGIRLLAPVSAALGSLLLAQAAEDLFPGRRLGMPAAVLLNATLLLAAGAVTMTPDTPLLFFWTASLWALGRLHATGRPGWWLAVGLLAGAALDSKYTAALLGLGIALWLLGTAEGRRWLRTPWPWAGGVLALLCFAPVLGWNASHGWASLAKQGGRTGDWRPADALRFVGELLGSQLGLGTPVVAVLCVGGIVAAARRWRQGIAPALLAAVTVPGALVFLEHAVGDRVQANWPAILFPGACIAAAAYVPRFWRPAAALGFAVGAVVYLQAATALIPLPRALDPTLIRLAGWDGLARQIAERHAGFVAADNYGLASMLAHDLPGPVVGAEPRWSLFALPAADIAGQSGLLVRSHRRAGAPDPAPWLTLAPAGTVARSRDGGVAEEYDLFRVTARQDMVRLPSR